MKNKISLLALILCAFALHAEDFTTLDGDTYTNCTIKRVEPDGLVIADADGVRKLRFKKLSPEIGIKYGFDPAKAEAFKAAEIQSAIAGQNQAVQVQTAQVAALVAIATPTPAPVTQSVQNRPAPPATFQLTTKLSNRQYGDNSDAAYKTSSYTILGKDTDGLNVKDESGRVQFIRASDLPSNIKVAYGL